MKEKEFNLSEKKLTGNVSDYYLECFVKEFIRRLKKETIKGKTHWSSTLEVRDIYNIIDNLAGDDLK